MNKRKLSDTDLEELQINLESHQQTYSETCYSYLWAIVFKHLPARDCLKLSILCKDVFVQIRQLISNSLTFRIPHESKLRVYSKAQSVIVSSHLSIPPQATKLEFIAFNVEHFNNTIPFISSKITDLTVSHFDGDVRDLPRTLTKLITAYEFNQPIDDLPPTLTHLQTGGAFSQIMFSQPTALSFVKCGSTLFSSYYSQNFTTIRDPARPRGTIIKSLEDHCTSERYIYPSFITKLTTPWDFNQPVDSLPPLTHLIFGYSFNQSVDNLPETLTHLTLGHLFTCSINHLPKALTHLAIGYSFDGSVDSLPVSLTHLTIGPESRFNGTVDNLPSSLVYLSLGSRFSGGVNALPANLKHLVIGDNFDNPITNLPASLTRLTVGFNFNYSIDCLPISVTHIKTGDAFNQPIFHPPPTLVFFEVGNDFDQPVDKLPTTLTHFSAGMKFNQPVDKLLATLTHLSVGDYFCQPTHHFPPTLHFTKQFFRRYDTCEYEQNSMIAMEQLELELETEQKSIKEFERGYNTEDDLYSSGDELDEEWLERRQEELAEEASIASLAVKEWEDEQEARWKLEEANIRQWELEELELDRQLDIGAS